MKNRIELLVQFEFMRFMSGSRHKGWAATLCALLGRQIRILPRNDVKEKTMKTITASLFALVLSAPFALADGCGMHGEQEASMACAIGQAWDAEAKQCVDTSA